MNKKRSINITALLLSLLLLFQANVAFATAGTISGNQPAGEEAIGTISGNQPAGEEAIGTVSENQPLEGEEAVSGESLTEIQAGAAGPANPVHHCTKKDDGSDYTDFSYVYFGSYPQSEVTDSATIAAIEKAITTSKAAETGIDVWVNGIKYRRISKADTNNDAYFDEVKHSGFRYFKWERIKWKVLKNNGRTLFVTADKAIDCKIFDTKSSYKGWAISEIRSWLNNSFCSSAFNYREQSAIVMQTVITENEWATSNDIYILSKTEVSNPEYGFCDDTSVYSMSRRAKVSDYANARGATRSSSADYRYNGDYWLRSRYYYDAVECVGIKGWCIDKKVELRDKGVCPALHIDLSSDVWFMTDDGTSGNGGEETTVSDDPGKAKETKVTKLTLTAPSGKLAAGKKVTLTLQVFPENADNKAVSFQSSNSQYASVDQTGKVTIKKAGAGKNVTITASALDGSQVKASCKFKIMKHAVKKITLKAPAKKLKAGKTMTIKATVKTTGKSANKSLTWTSSNKKYATVNSKGKVTAKKAGKGKTVTITAKSTDGSNKKAQVKIRIE